MMKCFYRMAAAGTIVLSLAGCKEKIGNGNIRPEASDEIVFTISGANVFDYNEQTWQDGGNTDRNTFILVSDDGNEWLNVRCSDFPEQAGQIVYAELEWKTSGMDKSTKKDVDMEVLQSVESAKIISLWNKKNSILIGLPNAR